MSAASDDADKVTSRNFRERLREFLIEWREDTANEDLRREFQHDPELDLDPEVTGDLGELFQISGLDPAAPGHWQLLTVAIVNFMTLREGGAPQRWTDEAKLQFLQDMFETKQEHPAVGRLQLCLELKRKYVEMGLAQTTQGWLYSVDEESLRVRFQSLLRQWKTRAARGGLSPRQRKYLEAFD